jgi:hypothetical protein
MEGEEKFRDLQKEIEKQYYNKTNAKKHIDKHFKDLKKYNKNFSCYTLENFTDVYFLNIIKTCEEIKKEKKK